jgi:hypothetical protein
MTGEGAVRDDALRLLWTMHKHRVGDLVNPSGAAHEAGLTPSTPRYKAAVTHLERERAIEPDEEASRIANTKEPYYRITAGGMAMLSGYMPS